MTQKQRDEIFHLDPSHHSHDIKVNLANMAHTIESVACSFAPELIEMVIHDIPILDLMSAASNMPPTWRAVIETSKIVINRLEHFPWDKYRDPPTPKSPVMLFRKVTPIDRHPYYEADTSQSKPDPILPGQSCAIKYVLPNIGTLYIRRRQPRKGPSLTANTTPSEGFFFVPTASPSTIRILDPAPKNIKYTPGPRFGHGFVDLRDCEGMLAFSKGISTGERDLLFKYVITFYGGEDCDENGLLRDAKKVDKGVGTAKKYVGVMGSGVGTDGTAGESGGLRRSGRIVKKTEKGESLTTK